MTLDLTVLPCPTCGRDCFAEAPPCREGHGDECPDRACVVCGTALAVDVWTIDFLEFALRGPAQRAA